MAYKFVINAGHGQKNNGLDPGAIGATGYKEYIETKEIADLVSIKLQYNGIETLVIQDGDLEDITNKSNSWKADYFVSIHCNSFSADSHGVETFSLISTGKGRILAESIHKELVPATGLYDRGLKTANYYVLKYTDCPAVLTEIGFISNPTEEALMKDSTWDNKVSTAIAKGICNFLGITYIDQTSEQIQNNNGDDNVKFAVLGFSLKDLGACMLVAEKYSNCAIYFRNSDKSFNQDCLKAETLFVVGGTSVGHKNEKLLSGLSAKDTLQAVVNIL
jgi:N-acetylmuramoyl-L-alanine amidase